MITYFEEVKSLLDLSDAEMHLLIQLFPSQFPTNSSN